MEQQIQLNDHNKQEYPPMHTAEHLLNATMVKTFGCPRSRNAHIERKKSKCDYILSSCPTAEQIQSIEDRVNEVISQNLPVTVEFMTHEQAKDIVDLSKLPADASETLRIVRIEIMMPAPASDCMYPILLKWVPSKSLVMIMTKKGKH